MSDPLAPARVSTGMRRALWPLCLAALAACGDGQPGGPLTDLQPKLNEPFALEIGQSALFLEPAVTITFEAVPSDSRCPIDATCIWSGDGVVQLALHVGPPDGDGPDVLADLHTNLDPKAAPWGVYYEVRLLSLDPQPSLNRPIGEYRATLVVKSH